MVAVQKEQLKRKALLEEVVHLKSLKDSTHEGESKRHGGKMMQIMDTYNQKHSLFNAMNKFIAAVNNMDQTVMVPSLLRDVPLEDENKSEVNGVSSTGASNYYSDKWDMYNYFVLLKSIKNDIEWGVVQLDDRKKDKAATIDIRVDEVEGEEDLQKQFHYHLNGLYTVLSKLTRKANTLTNRYKQEIGFGSWGH